MKPESTYTFPLQHLQLAIDCPAAFDLKHLGGSDGYDGTPSFDVFQHGRTYILVQRDCEVRYYSDARLLVEDINKIATPVTRNIFELCIRILESEYTTQSLTEQDIDSLAVITLIRRVNALEADTNARLDSLEQSLSDRLVEIQEAFSHYTARDADLGAAIDKLGEVIAKVDLRARAPMNYNIYNNPQSPIV